MPDSDRRRPIVVSEASPLIFLAKINRLELIESVTLRKPVVLQGVMEEVLSDRAMPVEAERLRKWRSAATVVDYTGSIVSSEALSSTDHSSLAWAVENRAEWLQADERLLRRFARERGIQGIGFCGLLLQAVRMDQMTSQQAHLNNYRIAFRLSKS